MSRAGRRPGDWTEALPNAPEPGGLPAGTSSCGSCEAEALAERLGDEPRPPEVRRGRVAKGALTARSLNAHRAPARMPEGDDPDVRALLVDAVVEVVQDTLEIEVAEPRTPRVLGDLAHVWVEQEQSDDPPELVADRV